RGLCDLRGDLSDGQSENKCDHTKRHRDRAELGIGKIQIGSRKTSVADWNSWIVIGTYSVTNCGTSDCATRSEWPIWTYPSICFIEWQSGSLRSPSRPVPFKSNARRA